MVDRYKDKILKSSEYALIGVIALEVFFYIYVNIFRLSDIVDVDFARVLRHVVEMGDKRTVFLPLWNYITTAELDHSAILALPIYVLTGRIMLSYGIANLINIAIWLTVLYRLLELTGLSRRYKLLATALVLTLFDFGMLAYSNMLFIGAEHYTHKVLIPLMFILLILTPTKKRRTPGMISLCLLYFALLFITAISSGIYVFICGIAPVIIMLIIRFVLRGKDNDTIYRIIMSVCSVIITFAGIVVCKAAHVTPNSELAVYKSMDDIRNNLFSTFLDLVEMFRVFPEKNVPVLSLSSMMSIDRLFIFVIILIFGLRSVGKLAATDAADPQDDKSVSGGLLMAEQLLISVFLWNYFILFVSGSQQRYHILGAVPLMICAVVELAGFIEGVSKSDKDDRAGFKTLLLSLTVAAIVLLDLYQVLWGSRQYFHREDYSKAVNEAVISFMEENDAGSAFSLYESGYGTEWLRAADKTRSYETYLPDTGQIINHDFYYSDMDRSAFSDRNAIIATDDEFDSCPAFIRDNYSLKGEALNYNIYLSENNPIDGMSGPIDGMDTIDLVTAPGYEYKGETDGSGHLNTESTGEVLISPVFDIVDPVTWTMEYETDHDADSVVELYADDEIVNTIHLSAEDNKAELTLSGNGSYRIVVNKSGEGKLFIGNMRFSH